MKLCVAFLLVVCAFSIDAKVIRIPRNSKALNDAVARTIAMHIAEKWSQKDPRGPVLPEFEDPLDVEHKELDLSTLGIEGLSGTASFSNGQVTGLSTVVDDLGVVVVIPARLNYKLETGTVAAKGEYEASATLNDDRFEGAGHVEAEIVHLDVHVEVRVIVNLITNRFTVTRVIIHKIDFESVHAVAEGLNYNGEPVDWDAVNEDAKQFFQDWLEENRAAVEDRLKEELAELIKDCKVTDVAGGDYSCIIPPESQMHTRARLFSEVLKYIA